MERISLDYRVKERGSSTVCGQICLNTGNVRSRQVQTDFLLRYSSVGVPSKRVDGEFLIQSGEQFRKFLRVCRDSVVSRVNSSKFIKQY